MTYTILFENNPDPKDVQLLGDRIQEYANKQKGHEPLDFYAFFIRDENNEIQGGVNGVNLYGCLYIDQLWVAESLRAKGYGTKLIELAEKHGIELGCTFATVNTMDWEALGFYKKLGYQIEFERHGFLKDSIFYFLRKNFIHSNTIHMCKSTLNDFHQKLAISTLNDSDLDEIVSAFKNIGWNKPRSIYEAYLKEQNLNLRVILVLKFNGQFCGYVTIKWKSDYQPFSDNNIPEISDLNVLPDFRKKGFGTMLIKQCENTAKDRGYAQIGLGVGMTADYGSAQRLYVQLGYVPDGNGIHYKCTVANYSETVIVDDDLVLYLQKTV